MQEVSDNIRKRLNACLNLHISDRPESLLSSRLDSCSVVRSEVEEISLFVKRLGLGLGSWD